MKATINKSSFRAYLDTIAPVIKKWGSQISYGGKDSFIFENEGIFTRYKFRFSNDLSDTPEIVMATSFSKRDPEKIRIFQFMKKR
jgi:hypothetical protein